MIAALSLAFFVEAGASYFQTHENGVWFQKGLPYDLRTTSPTLEVGVRKEDWQVGASYLGKVSSQARATVRDEDYSPAEWKCLRRCDALADFSGQGKVWGFFVRYGRPWEIGVLVFRPSWRISVSDFHPDGLKSNGTFAETYYHKPKWQLAPSIGYTQDIGGGLSVSTRLHLGVKARGDWVVGLYNGVVVSSSIRYEFK